MSKYYDVIVVGGGMVGAAAALGLADLNLEVLLLEKQPPVLEWQGNEPFSIRVSALTRSSENILRNLGAWQGIEKRRSQPFTAMQVWEQNSPQKMTFSAQQIGEENLGFTVENQWVQAALWEAIEKSTGITTHIGDELVEVLLPEQGQKDACVQIKTAAQHLFSSKLVVAADGATSKTRQLANMGISQKDYDQCAIVGCVKTQKSHQNTCWQRYTDQGPFAYLAMAQGYSSIAWYLPIDKMPWALGLSDEAFAQEIYKASGGILGELTEVLDRRGFPLIRRHANHYVKSGLALVGDSAHTINPQAGQGVNIGLLDVASLVDQLARALAKGQSIGDYAVLRRYERSRRGDNATVQRSMEFFDWLYTQAPESKVGLRSVSKAFMANELLTSPVKKILMKQVLYGREPLPKLAKRVTI